MTNQEKIVELNKIWYDVVCGGEYHKDRDCHFYIYSHYFYGDKVEFTVEHRGYIKHDYEDTHWETYEQAEKELIRLLFTSIYKEITWYIDHYGDPQWDQHGRYDKAELQAILLRAKCVNSL